MTMSSMTQEISLDVLSAGQPGSGSLDPSSVAVVTQPAAGDAAIRHSQQVTYRPVQGVTGVFTFTYQICNSLGLCSTAPVTVTVTP